MTMTIWKTYVTVTSQEVAIATDPIVITTITITPAVPLDSAITRSIDDT